MTHSHSRDLHKPSADDLRVTEEPTCGLVVAIAALLASAQKIRVARVPAIGLSDSSNGNARCVSVLPEGYNEFCGSSLEAVIGNFCLTYRCSVIGVRGADRKGPVCYG